MLCSCDIEEKNLLLLCISKWIRRQTIAWKSLHFFVLDTKWVRSQLLSGCLAQPSTRSGSAWMMVKVSTDVQAVVERLLWIVTACEMRFKRLLRMASRKLKDFSTALIKKFLWINSSQFHNLFFTNSFNSMPIYFCYSCPLHPDRQYIFFLPSMSLCVLSPSSNTSFIPVTPVTPFSRLRCSSPLHMFKKCSKVSTSFLHNWHICSVFNVLLFCFKINLYLSRWLCKEEIVPPWIGSATGAEMVLPWSGGGS